MRVKKINIAIVGATGYVGLDLINILSRHPKVNIKYLCAQKNLGKKIQYFDKRIKKNLPSLSNLKKANLIDVDLLFLSLPNGEAQKLVKNLYKHKHLKFIDLSADFRIESSTNYKKWYKINHKAKLLIKKSIYSISEFASKEIKKFRIISNPGCYPTSIQLALNPLIKKNLLNFQNIVIDSKSGYSGAGKNYLKKFKDNKNLYKSVYAYSPFNHRHMAELNQEFKKITNKKISYNFNPHLLPAFRGILSSIYVKLNSNVGANKIVRELKNYYKNKKFVKVLDLNMNIGTGNVINTNMCHISICKSSDKNKIIIFSAIDNLIKGASGQAVQNMNLLYGFNESIGLQ